MANLQPGSRVREVKETEVLPPTANEATPAAFYDRDFWEVIADITRQQKWADHIVRVYRADDRWEKGGSPENNKLTDAFNEETVRKNWGGGRYLLWLYGPPSGSKLVMRPFKLELEGVPRSSAPLAGSAASGDHGPMMVMLQELLTEMRASRGGNLTQDAMKNALEIQFQAMRQALEIAKPASAPSGPSPVESLFNQLLAALIPALITKFTNPANPVEDFSKVASAAKELVGLLGGGKGEKPDTLATIVNALPTVIEKAAGGLKEIRLAAEAQERAARISSGKIIDVQPTATTGADATSAASPAAAAPPQASAPVPPPAAPSAERKLTPEEEQQIEYGIFMRGVFKKVVAAIQNDPECTGETLFDFLQNTAPEIIPQMKAATREQIIVFFRSDPVLSQVADHPKLPQIVDEFLKIAREESTT